MSQLRTRVSALFRPAVLSLAIACVIWAQAETGQITGTVTDPSGAIVPTASVKIRSTSTGAERLTTGSGAGDFVVSNLLPGEYEVTVQSAGFTPFERKVIVSAGAKVGLDVRLQVGQTGTTVQVSEAAVQVDTVTQTLVTTVNTTQLSQLPTLTRNPYDLVAISGNVSDAGSTSNGGQQRGVNYAINGQRPSDSNVLLDGAANNNEFDTTVGQTVPLDSIQEFSLLTSNFTAEYGRAGGGIVNVVTKSGTNGFHGTAYEFNRVSDLSSNSFDNNARGLPKTVFTRNQFGYSVGGPIVKNKLFFFSSTEWTRIRSLATQTVWVPTPQLIATSSPNTQSFFDAYGKLKSNNVLIQSETINQFAAQGTDICGTSAGCLAFNPNTPIFNQIAYTYAGDAGGGVPGNSYANVERIDYNLTDRTQMYFRYALESIAQPPGVVSNSPYVGFDSANTNFNNNALYSIIHTFAPNFVSQSKAVFNRLNNQQPFGQQPPVPTLYVNGNGAYALGGINVIFPGYDPFTPGNGIPFGGPQNFVQLYEDLTWTHGKHDIRFGGSFQYLRDNRTFGAYETAGDYLSSAGIGPAVSNFLAGQLYEINVAINPQGKYPGETVSLPLGPPNFSRSNRYKEGAVYVQDSWKILPRFTANIGVRWEHFGVQHNKNPQLDSNFYDPANQINTPAGIAQGQVFIAPQSPVGGLWKPEWHDFAPRLGFAWDVFGNGKTSVRGGYGIGYIRNFGNVTFNVIQNPPNYETVQSVSSATNIIPISPNNFGPLSGTSGTIKLPRASLRNVDANILTAYANFWDFSIQQQLTNNLLVEADYTGSRGVHLYDIESVNQQGFGNVYLGDPCSYAAGDCLNRSNTQYSNINRRGSRGFSNYNAVNLKATARGAYGLTFTANYTWSHAIDDLSSTFSDANGLGANNGQFMLGYLNPYDPKMDTGSADFDIRQRVTISAVWEIPYKGGSGIRRQLFGGWSLDPIFTAETGAPYSIFDCSNTALYCPRADFTVQVPNAGPSNPPPVGGLPNTFNYFNFPANGVNVGYTNPTYFYTNLPPWPIGMSGRNAFTAPGTWFLNLGLYKTFALTERIGLQLRGEAYNIFNHANLYVVGTAADVSSSAYIPACRGCTGTTSDRRNLQLAAKITF